MSKADVSSDHYCFHILHIDHTAQISHSIHFSFMNLSTCCTHHRLLYQVLSCVYTCVDGSHKRPLFSWGIKVSSQRTQFQDWMCPLIFCKRWNHIGKFRLCDLQSDLRCLAQTEVHCLKPTGVRGCVFIYKVIFLLHIVSMWLYQKHHNCAFFFIVYFYFSCKHPN